MSGIFSKLDVVTQEEHDSECSRPTVFVRPAAPSYLQMRSSSTNYSISDSDNVQPCPDPKVATTPSNWLPRITARSRAKEAAITALRDRHSQELEHQTKFCVGAHVSTKHKLIAPLSNSPVKKRRSRIAVTGEIMAKSEYQPYFWLVKFTNGKTFYCNSNVLKFLESKAPSSVLTLDDSKMLSTKKVDKTFINEQKIMSTILCSKIHDIPGHPTLTFDALLALFKPRFPWLTIGKLKYHVEQARGKLNKHNDQSWISVLDYETEQPNNNVDGAKSVTEKVIEAACINEENLQAETTTNSEATANTSPEGQIVPYDDDYIPDSVLERRINRHKNKSSNHLIRKFCSSDESESSDVDSDDKSLPFGLGCSFFHASAMNTVTESATSTDCSTKIMDAMKCTRNIHVDRLIAVNGTAITDYAKSTRSAQFKDGTEYPTNNSVDRRSTIVEFASSARSVELKGATESAKNDHVDRDTTAVGFASSARCGDGLKDGTECDQNGHVDIVTTAAEYDTSTRTAARLKGATECVKNDRVNTKVTTAAEFASSERSLGITGATECTKNDHVDRVTITAAFASAARSAESKNATEIATNDHIDRVSTTAGLKDGTECPTNEHVNRTSNLAEFASNARSPQLKVATESAKNDHVDRDTTAVGLASSARCGDGLKDGTECDQNGHVDRMLFATATSGHRDGIKEATERGASPNDNTKEHSTFIYMDDDNSYDRFDCMDDNNDDSIGRYNCFGKDNVNCRKRSNSIITDNIEDHAKSSKLITPDKNSDNNKDSYELIT